MRLLAAAGLLGLLGGLLPVRAADFTLHPVDAGLFREVISRAVLKSPNFIE
jgi:hypothetical protein